MGQSAGIREWWEGVGVSGQRQQHRVVFTDGRLDWDRPAPNVALKHTPPPRHPL